MAKYWMLAKRCHFGISIVLSQRQLRTSRYRTSSSPSQRCQNVKYKSAPLYRRLLRNGNFLYKRTHLHRRGEEENYSFHLWESNPHSRTQEEPFYHPAPPSPSQLASPTQKPPNHFSFVSLRQCTNLSHLRPPGLWFPCEILCLSGQLKFFLLLICLVRLISGFSHWTWEGRKNKISPPHPPPPKWNIKISLVSKEKESFSSLPFPSAFPLENL